MDYRLKEIAMCQALEGYQTPAGFRSSYKGVPFSQYEEVKRFIDFTKYYVMFRGPRPSRAQSSTRKRDAKAFDIYKFSDRDTERNRIEREAFYRGVQWAKDNV
jgi:hypothetical protein